MQYLTFQDYTALGGEIFAKSLLKFNRVEFAARKRIDSLTGSRLHKLFASAEKEPEPEEQEPPELPQPDPPQEPDPGDPPSEPVEPVEPTEPSEPTEPQEEPEEPKEVPHPILETVKMLMLELIERGYMGKLDGEDYTNESQGRVSVSRESKAGKADQLIKDYLGNEYIDGAPLIERSGIKFSPVRRAL